MSHHSKTLFDILSVHLLLTALVAFGVLTGCKKDSDNSTGPELTCDIMHSSVKGVAYSPLGFPETYENTGAFYTEIEEIGNFSVFMNSLWRDDINSSGEIPQTHLSLINAADNHCFLPVASFGWRSGHTTFLDHPDNGVNNWTNETTKESFLRMLENFASTYKPPYLFIGNEVNFYFENFPSDYQNWIEFYETAYRQIKDANSSTKVGTIFNYEHLAGLGKNVGWNAPQWGAIDQFDSDYLDVIGLTVYPFLSENMPQTIPDTYLKPLTERAVVSGKPLFITETGWPGNSSLNDSRSWSMGEDHQITYVEKLGSILSSQRVAGVQWLFMNEMRNTCNSCDEWINFGSISLKDGTGKKRPVYEQFINISF